MPTPMPAFAPVDNPALGLVSVIPLINDPSGPVLIADGAAVPLPQYSPESEMMQVAPVLQQPPPNEVGQLNCPAEQPLGTIGTSVVGATTVDKHELVVHE
jgi:hypothetical protein